MGDFNRNPGLLAPLLDADLRSRISFVAPSSFTQASGDVLDYAITGNSDISRRYSPPSILAILAFACLRTFLASDHFPVNFRKF